MTVLFDGACNLCSGSMRMIAAADRKHALTLHSARSPEADRALLPFGRSGASVASIIAIDEAGLHERSDAALRIACALPMPWPLLGVFFAIPVSVRDAVYDVIARNRYRFFGRR